MGRITSSNAHTVLNTDQERPAPSVILAITQLSKSLAVPSLQWGNENEPKARKAYERLLQKEHSTSCKISEAGILLDSEYHFIGASTDGIGSCDCDENCENKSFLVEIKCTYKHKDKTTINQCYEDKLFWLENDGSLKKNHQYMTQVQMQLYVYKINKCHFVTWSPNFLHVVVVPRDDNFKDQVEKLASFHTRYICPELVTRKIEQTKVNKKKVVELYCYCQTRNNENKEMIGCDNPDCKYKWIHYACIKPPMKRAPKSKWFCKDCKKNCK